MARISAFMTDEKLGHLQQYVGRWTKAQIAARYNIMWDRWSL